MRTTRYVAQITLVMVLLSTITSVARFLKNTQWSNFSNPLNSTPLQTQVQKLATAPHYRIAIIIPWLTPSIEIILKGFREGLEKEALFTPKFRLFNPEGDRIRLRSMVEEIFMEGYDLIHSIGMEPTKMLKEIGEQRNDSTPIVFNTVQDPQGAGLIASEESSGNNLTGIAGNFDYTSYANLLVAFKPNIQHILIVYNPTQQAGAIEQAKQHVQKLFEAKGVKVSSIVVFRPEEIPQRVTPQALQDNVDFVVVLCDNTITTGIQHLTKLCNTYGVPITVPYSEYAKKGLASICFSLFEYDIGGFAVKPIRQILEDGKHPSQIPVTGYPKRRKFLINAHAMKRQSLKLDRNIEFLVRHTHVVGKK